MAVFRIVCVIVLALIIPILAWDENSGVINVHVVPHSHNDPGWWRTFEGYYQEWTKGILNSIVQVLSEGRDRKFIWAEISYFQRWWQDASPSVRETVQELVNNKQLEFVTAGWVMNDEANSHIIDIINQLTEGHEWLYNTLHTKPTIGWAIDPFGHSPTMAYVLEQMGFEAMVINRAHREIKQDFRDHRSLEFFWTGELLNSSTSFNILTHMLAWNYYDIPNTCGPDWDTCASFDFERPVAVTITSANVKERSELLVSMYKQKAKLFNHNILLIPLGDDFKYKTYDMTNRMFTQYEMMFEYINSHKELGVNIKFSTLNEYFAELPDSSSFPTYQGDFFTYCDQAEDYWSGYFTTRPFMKGLTRSTQAILRTGEILATLARSHVDEEHRRQWFESIERARRNIALFQHHDGITGTARRAVVQDYGERLLTSLASVASYASDMALVVLSKPGAEKTEDKKLSWTTEPSNSPKPGTPRVLEINSDVAVVVVFNPLEQSRTEVVSIMVNTHNVRVTDSDGQDILAQVDPVWENGVLSTSQYLLHFMANIPALGLTTYFVSRDESGVAAPSSVIEYSPSTTADKSEAIAVGWSLDLKPLQPETNIAIENSVYKVELTGSGRIKTATRLADGKQTLSVAIEQNFLAYTTNGRSGAYLFIPSGPAQLYQDTPVAVRVMSGPLVNTVQVVTTTPIKERLVRLYDCRSTYTSKPINACYQSQAIEVLHKIELIDSNKEVITRFTTNVSNAGRLYTDSNGFDMRERLYDSNMPIQGNYYPITAATYIETQAPVSATDDHSKSPVRVTILSHQAHGVGSLSEGAIEIMLDRRLNQDDGRGLGESVTDNVRTEIPLWLVIEPTIHLPFDSPSLSVVASDVWNARNYPPHPMYTMIPPTTQPSTEWGTNHYLTLEPLSHPFPGHLRLLTLAPRDSISEEVIMRVYRPPRISLPISPLDTHKAVAPGEFNFLDIFSHLSVENAKETSLSLMYELNNTEPQQSFSLSPASIRSFVVNIQPKSSTGGNSNVAIATTPAPVAATPAAVAATPAPIAATPAPIAATPAAIPVTPKVAPTDAITTIQKGEYTKPANNNGVDKVDTEQSRDTGIKQLGTKDDEPEHLEPKDDIPDDKNEGPEGRTPGSRNIYGLFTVSLVFYLSMFMILAGGCFYCKHITRRISARISSSSIFKERDDRIVKLL